jgi:hypothetical protein
MDEQTRESRIGGNDAAVRLVDADRDQLRNAVPDIEDRKKHFDLPALVRFAQPNPQSAMSYVFLDDRQVAPTHHVPQRLEGGFSSPFEDVLARNFHLSPLPR